MEINKFRLKHVKKYIEIEKLISQTDDEFLDNIAKILQTNVDLIQFNQGENTTQEYLYLGKKIRELCSIFNTLFIIKNRIDIAKITNADGIILEKNEIPPQYAREILQEHAIIGFLSKEKNFTFENNYDFIIYKNNFYTKKEDIFKV